MSRRSDFIARALMTLLFSYGIAIGATFNGVLTPTFKFLNLIILALLAGGWLWIRWRRGWVWHHTPLDLVFVLWGLAFGLSLLANEDSWRRIAIGLWYNILYIGVWHVLQDSLANGGLSRQTLVDGLLISGLVVLIFGFVQLQAWLMLIASGQAAFELPRPVSTLGNSNALGNFLVVLIPFALMRFANAKNSLSRLIMALYILLALLLLFLTFSRGAWVGAAAALMTWGLLFLAQHQRLSRAGLQAWWQTQPGRIRAPVLIAGGLGLAAALFVSIIFLRSFQQSGRETTWRTGIYEAAVTLFLEKPLSGHGLFTFGRGLARLGSSPPDQLHSHAHNAPLHIAAELGLMGLVALAVTLVVIVWIARLNWRTIDAPGRKLLASAIAAVVGFAVHQLTDVPAMMPAIALTGLVALTLATTPSVPEPFTPSWRQRSQPLAMAGLWLGLMLTGLWSSRVYDDYVASLRYGIESGDFRGAAERLNRVTNAEPSLALYHKEQALMYSLAASLGDLDAARRGIETYERLIVLEPDYSIGWANLAALYWQLGEREQAIGAMRQALERAPKAWQLAVNLARYAEAVGDEQTAIVAYDQALREYPDASLYPELEPLAARRGLSSTIIELSIPAQVVELLEIGQPDAAAALWEPAAHGNTAQDYTISLLLALSRNDREAAIRWLAAVERVAANGREQAWVYLARARLAGLDGDEAAAEQALTAAREVLEGRLFDADFPDGLNIAHAQFLRLGLGRQFLPQLYYPVDSPILLFLLENTE